MCFPQIGTHIPVYALENDKINSFGNVLGRAGIEPAFHYRKVACLSKLDDSLRTLSNEQMFILLYQVAVVNCVVGCEGLDSHQRPLAYETSALLD